ncbi:hypothetical protein [Paraburkholderia caballeronis]|uniref:Uncharacterized protein n=1 Tax=Paraburkholderia caballeronis TaxID=416943 RepID=A0A1H7H902_9BURK|nr:hypothetical protein [Paraburkholderia caballeronis]PXW29602.1 hypothetical protein C7403_101458 [Paraburkholderia caballeronis]PXX04861.1 hypothetical protein C7407_101458 [Paraburkholderia caballeronis]RAK05922.1 hypothetical protein C7409_101458 [Paraburkholderia caballeronis]SEB43850.1 hypothetical protein SAMN05445871_0133 [Paraburkholderia caballeronis]SEK46754.1 hypothetical protein SAMN05192542_102177 [Paraburkholderia caballeronis]
MSVIQLRHYKKLRYPASTPRSLPILQEEIVERYADATIVSFRPLESGKPDEIRRDMHACVRLLDLPKTDLVFVGIEADSPLAPLIFWDAAHALEVGRAITLLGESGHTRYLLQAYYSDSFAVEVRDETRIVLRKVKPLPVEVDAGLDRWSFGIPVGPEDSTLLNVTVKRILELDIPEKEILLCGRPGPGFKYMDHVRIVGEDITAPPVRICAKKNRLADEARFENLCIIHDRVFLPKDFHRAVQRFGDHYPLVAFQSIYFDDKYNAIPRRYSDFNTAPNVVAQSERGIMRSNDLTTTSAFSPAVLSITEQAGFYYANALRHSRTNYPTGSLYLAKRSVWKLCPQDENLYWTEFEDIDQGLRADALGIPSRVNPYAITQSLISRPLLSISGAIHYETLRGGTKMYRAMMEAWSIARKPLLKVTQEQGQQHLARFSMAFVPESIRATIPSNAVLTSRLRVRALLRTIEGSRLPIRQKDVERFLTGYEKQLVFDQAPYNWKEWAAREILLNGRDALDDLVGNDLQLVNHLSQRPKGEVFAKTLKDYLPERGLGVCLGSFFSALMLRKYNKEVFYFPGGLMSRYRAIRDTTPFVDYSREAL